MPNHWASNAIRPTVLLKRWGSIVSSRASHYSPPALLALLLLAACTGPPAATFELLTSEVSGTDPALSPNGQWVVFSLLGDLWRVPREGGRAHSLTSGPAYDSRPAFLPDGRLVFQSDRSGNEDLWLLDEVGAAPRPLTFDAAEDSWPTVSPDGAWIVFTSDRAGSQDLWRLPASGGPPRRLTFLPGQETQAGYWRDGLWLVFSYEDATDADLFELPARGGAVRRLLQDDLRLGAAPGKEELVYWRVGGTAREAWLRRGERETRLPELDLAQQARWRPTPTPEGGWIFYRNGKLWELRAGQTRPIEFLADVRMNRPAVVRPSEPARLDATARWILDPALSPDGRFVAYSARGDLWIQPSTGGPARRLTAGEFLDRHPVFSPDGQQIAYVSEGHLRLVSTAGGPSRRLTRDSGSLSEPRWLPTGEGLVAARRGPDQRFDVVEVPLEGIGARRLAGIGGRRPWRPHPTAAPGGVEIVFDAPDPGVGGLWTVGRPPAESSRELRALFGRPVRAARLSPDGTRVLLIDDEGLTVASAPARGEVIGDERRIERAPAIGAAWCDSSNALIFARAGAIERVRVESGQRDRWEIELPPAAPRLSTSPWALAADRVWTGHELLRGGVVVIEGNRVRAVGRRGEIELPEGAWVVELGDATILPGLIDLHVHLSDPRDLRELALAGVTSVRDAGGDLETRTTLQWMAADRVLPSPRVLHCGEFLEGPNGIWGNLVSRLTDEAVVPARVSTLEAAGAWGAKIYPSLSRRMAESVVREAAQRGLRTTAHVTDARRFFEMILAGCGGIEHGPSEPIYGDLAALAAASGVTVTPTIIAVEGAQSRVAGRWPDSEGVPSVVTGKLAGVGTLARAGVRLGAGTDAGLPPIEPGRSLVHEVELLALAGLTTEAAIRAATTDAAAALGLEDRIGHLAPGAMADLIAVHGDPFEDLSRLHDPHWVVRDGWVLKQGERPTD